MQTEALDDLPLESGPGVALPPRFSRHEGAWTACAFATLVYACTVALPGFGSAAFSSVGAFGLVAVACALLGLGFIWLRRIDEGALPISFAAVLWLSFPSVAVWFGLLTLTPLFRSLTLLELFLFSFIWMMLALLSMALVRVWRVAESPLAAGIPAAGLAARARDYLTLAKPGLNALVLFTAFVGFYLASIGPFNFRLCLIAMLGTGLFAAGSSALNQFIERRVDALMRRTAVRPLPAGRIRPRNAVLFGMLLIFAGAIILTLFVNLMTAFLAMATLAVYLFLYTPLKRIDTFSTLAGGIAGALPPVIGWTAAGGRLDSLALTLFFILFLWQVPHFLSIAWKYRDQYRDAGFLLITVDDESGRVTARQSLLYAVVLFLVGMLPLLTGRAGALYGWGAALLGGALTLYALFFLLSPTRTTATRLFFVSIIYLPLILIVMMLDKALA